MKRVVKINNEKYIKVAKVVDNISYRLLANKKRITEPELFKLLTKINTHIKYYAENNELYIIIPFDKYLEFLYYIS